MAGQDLIELPLIRERAAISRASAERRGDHSSFARIGYVAIVLAFGCFGTWAAFAPLDSATVADAQVAVSSDRKLIQHLEGGIVREILVREAQRVKKDQVLFRLRPIKAEADSDLLRKQLRGTLAKEARLLAERDVKPSITFPPEVLAERHQPGVAASIYDQEKQFQDRRRSLAATLDITKRRIDQTGNDIEGKTLRQTSLKAQFASLDAEIKAVSGLAERGFFPRNRLRAIQRQLLQIEGDLGGVTSDIARSRQVIAESKLQLKLVYQRYVEEANRELGDVRGRLTELRQKLKVASDVLSRVDVRAPQNGIVQGLKVHSVGAVVRPGDPLAEIVTLEDGLIMTAKIKPNDIDSVQAGQMAEIRFPAYYTKQRQVTRGRVATVASDAVLDEVTRTSYFKARVVIDEATLPPGLKQKLVPGMPASVMITIGERTVLQYLMGPLFDRLAQVMRER